MYRGDYIVAKKKILIITGSFGNGHIKVTNNVVEELSNYNVDILVHDLFLEAHPKLTKVAQAWYINSFTYFRPAYAMFYYNQPTKVERCFYNRYGLKRLVYLIDKHQPDMILSTFPTPVLRHIKRFIKHDVKIHTIITDYRFHKNWLIKKSDYYYVGSEKLKQELINHESHPENISITGIPVERKFSKHVNRSIFLRRHQLNPNKKTIMIATGAFGVLKGFQKTISEILNKKNIQIVVICGNNAALKTKLEHAFHDNPSVCIIGYTNEMSEWMAVSDILITKPGGITITEGLTRNIPMVLYNPAPGQEKENALLFEANNLAQIADTKEELLEIVESMISNVFLRKRMIRKMKEFEKPRATEDIVKHIVKSLDVKHSVMRINS